MPVSRRLIYIINLQGKLMKNSLLFAVLIIMFAAGAAAPQQYKVNLKLGFWADTAGDKDYKEVVELLKNYLESYPDSAYDNPYWNNAEKKEFTEFDFSIKSLFSKDYTPAMHFALYDAYVLKIEKKDTNYYLQTMYFSTKLDSSRQWFNPLAIVNYYAVKENGRFRLANAFRYETAEWYSNEYKHITYHYRNKKYFTKDAAEAGDRFCDSLMRRFGFAEPKRIHVYAVDWAHEIGKLLGYEHYIYGWALGRSFGNIILSGNRSVFYPHELVHQFVPKNEKRLRLVEEGFATWLGGTMGEDYGTASAKFARAFRKIDTASFKWALKCEELSCYALFAIIIDVVHDLKGDAGVLQLLDAPTVDEKELMTQIEKITGRGEAEFIKLWEEKISRLSETKTGK
jgi:hypothetical protein